MGDNQEAKNNEEMEELLRKLLETNKKEVRYARLAAFFMMALFLVFLAAAVILVPKVVETLSYANNTIVSAGQILEEADETIKNINTMSSSITQTSDNMNGMLTENAQELTKAVENMNSIDFDGLNKAIKDLQDAVGPFASFMNKFR